MTKENYVQDSLPNFEKAYAEARQADVNPRMTIARQYMHFVKMTQRCHDPKILTMIKRQKQKLRECMRRLKECQHSRV